MYASVLKKYHYKRMNYSYRTIAWVKLQIITLGRQNDRHDDLSCLFPF